MTQLTKVATTSLEKRESLPILAKARARARAGQKARAKRTSFLSPRKAVAVIWAASEAPLPAMHQV